ncbi:hypothetical protein BH11ACT8_BH11ACT8_27880 [soil metagenome]
MPLRPLGLGDIYDAAFRIIRFNPRATVGSAVIVAAGAALVPLLVVAALTWTIGLTYDPGSTRNDSTAGDIVSFGSVGLISFLSSIGLIFVTGMVAHVSAAAAIGKRLTLGQAWAATAGKRWRLVGLAAIVGFGTALLVGAYVVAWFVVVVYAGTATIVLWGVITVPLFVLGLWFVWIRVTYLPVAALMLEDVGVLGAIGRGYALTRRQFWRVFGIALLTVIIGQVAGGLLSLPFTIGGQIGVLTVGDDYSVLVLLVFQALGSIASTAFTAPFISAVTSLQYLDQRMRKEAYDVDLMGQAGVLRQ